MFSIKSFACCRLANNLRNVKFSKTIYRGFRSKTSNITPTSNKVSNKIQKESKLFLVAKYKGFALSVVLCSFGYAGLYKKASYDKTELYELLEKWSIKRDDVKFQIKMNEQVIDSNFLKILSANVCVFFLWRANSLQTFMTKWFTLSAVSGHRNLLSMILSAFSHASLVHLAVNMFVLKSFIQPWEDRTFPREKPSKSELFVPFYLSAAVASNLLSFVVKVITKTPLPSLGASGAIMGLLAYTCCKYPNSKLSLVFIPNWSFTSFSGLIGITAFDTIGLSTMLLARYISFRSPFDHAGHLGGLLFGIWYARGGDELLLKWVYFINEKWNTLVLKEKDK